LKDPLFPEILASDVPWITTDQMIEVDRAMMEDYSIVLLQMMENAGRCLAILARRRFLQDSPKGRTVWVLAGTGGNGGGALACARRLACWQADVCYRARYAMADRAGCLMAA
jgi:NAD(P)H-hydrate epimerase